MTALIHFGEILVASSLALVLLAISQLTVSSDARLFAGGLRPLTRSASAGRFSLRAVVATAAFSAYSPRWCNSPPPRAAPRWILLRGWFGVFPAALDASADTRNAQGLRAEGAGHPGWKTAADDILRAR